MSRALAAPRPLRVLACLVCLAAPAQAATCPASTAAWLDEASRELAIPIEARVCSPALTVVRLRPAGAPPLDVELAAGDGPAFRRAGGWRVSPIVEGEYQLLPAAQRAAYEALVARLEARPDLAGTAAARVPWVLLAGLVLAAVNLARAPRPGRRELSAAAGVFLAAAALRTALGAWGPLHVNGQAPLWIRGALVPSELHYYGPGYAELFGLLARAGPAPDTAIFAANVVLSALVPVLGYAIARGARLSRPAALAGAALLALDPVAVRISATEAYFVPIAALTAAAAGLLFSAARAWRRRDRLAAAAGWLAAGLFAAAAARIHPVAYLPVALVPLVALAGLRRRRALRTLVGFAVATAAIGGTVLITSGGPVLQGLTQPSLRPVLPMLQPLFGLAAAAIVTAVLLRRFPGLALAGFAGGAAMLLTRDVYSQHPLWQAAYDRLFAVALALGAASLVACLPRARMALGAGGALVPLGVLLAAGPWLTEPTTDQLEYLWVREVLRGLPSDCRPAAVTRAGDRVAELPDYVIGWPRAEPVRARSLGAGSVLAGAPGCTVYVRGSLCSSREGAPLCAAIEGSAGLEPIASTGLPARPSYAGFGYETDPVTVAAYRVKAQ